MQAIVNINERATHRTLYPRPAQHAPYTARCIPAPHNTRHTPHAVSPRRISPQFLNGPASFTLHLCDESIPTEELR